MSFLFGRKRVTRKKTYKMVKKPPARLIKACKKHGIKCTRKIGKRRVYKSTTVLKRLLRKKMKAKKGKSSKRRKTRKTRKTRKVSRSFRFGDAAPFTQPGNYGYNQEVKQNQGILSQSSQVVTASNNINRPPGFGADPANLPIYGVYRPFFTEQVPTQVGPNSIGFMGQPDGTLYPVGGPFSKYTQFGKRRRRHRKM
jgi:hypothetical protein